MQAKHKLKLHARIMICGSIFYIKYCTQVLNMYQSVQ